MRSLAPWLLGWLVTACVVATTPPPAPGAYEDVRRVVAALDDVAGEYPFTVNRGETIDPSRSKVLGRLLHDAERYAARFPAAERASLRELAASVAARDDPAEVVVAARELRGRLLASHQIVLAPGAPPSRARAEELWGWLCAGCHGSAGAGDGEQGLYLDPEPKDFHDPDFIATLTPSRAWSRIADGVPGTDMPQWGLFSSSERWGLAFLVLAFRHDADAAARGRAAAARVQAGASLVALADHTDDELLRELHDAGLDEAAASDALAFLRGEAAFEPTDDELSAVRAELAGATTSYRAQHDADALAHVAAARRRLSTRIDGIRAADAHLAAVLEHRLARLDAAIADGMLAESVELEIVNLEALLDRAARAARAPTLGDGARLALSWAAAAALGLGLALGRRRRASPVWWRAPAAGLAVGGVLGAALAPVSLGASIAAVGLATAAALALATTASWRDAAVTATAAALIGLALGAGGRALLAAAGTRGLAPWIAGVAAVAGVTLAGQFLAGRRHAAWAALEVVAVAVAAGASAGRGVWILYSTTVRPGPALHAWRIEALGLFPARDAIVVAAIVAGVALLCGARRALATGPDG